MQTHTQHDANAFCRNRKTKQRKEKGALILLVVHFLWLRSFSSVPYSSKFVSLSLTQFVVRDSPGFCGFRFSCNGMGMNCNEDQCSPSCDV